MTKKERRDVALAVAFADLRVVEDPDDRERVREEVAWAIGEQLGFGAEEFGTQVAALRMTEDSPFQT